MGRKKNYQEVLCIRSGDGFNCGEIYALVRDANNNGRHVVRADNLGDVVDYLLHDYVGQDGWHRLYSAELGDSERSPEFVILEEE